MVNLMYRIDGVDLPFRTLRAAKLHVFASYTQEERIKELKDAKIYKYVDDLLVTETPIIVTADGYSFGKTIKV